MPYLNSVYFRPILLFSFWCYNTYLTNELYAYNQSVSQPASQRVCPPSIFSDIYICLIPILSSVTFIPLLHQGEMAVLHHTLLRIMRMCETL